MAGDQVWEGEFSYKENPFVFSSMFICIHMFFM